MKPTELKMYDSVFNIAPGIRSVVSVTLRSDTYDALDARARYEKYYVPMAIAEGFPQLVNVSWKKTIAAPFFLCITIGL